MKHKSPIMQMVYHESGSYRELPLSKEALDCTTTVVAAEKAFLETITDHPEIKKLYDATIDAIENLHARQLDDCYAEAFRFGFLLALDVVKYEPK